MARLTSDESLMGLLLFLPSCAKLKDLDLCGKTRQLNSSCRALLNLTLLLPSVGLIGSLQPFRYSCHTQTLKECLRRVVLKF